MQVFNMPANHYSKTLCSSRVKKFTLVHVSSFFGRRRAAIFLRATPIEDIQLFIADPGYETSISIFYPIYLGEIVMLGYLIINKFKNCEFIVSDSKVVLRNADYSTDEDSNVYEKGFVSKQMIMLKSKNSNLFIPSVKYETQKCES